MYINHKEKIKPIFEINVIKHKETCHGCPTIFDFQDNEGTKYHFRLRNGFARIKCEDTDEILISGDMNEFDGVCNWDDVIKWAKKNSVLINY